MPSTEGLPKTGSGVAVVFRAASLVVLVVGVVAGLAAEVRTAGVFCASDLAESPFGSSPLGSLLVTDLAGVSPLAASF
jgi:hypothetical protein